MIPAPPAAGLAPGRRGHAHHAYDDCGRPGGPGTDSLRPAPPGRPAPGQPGLARCQQIGPTASTPILLLAAAAVGRYQPAAAAVGAFVHMCTCTHGDRRRGRLDRPPRCSLRSDGRWRHDDEISANQRHSHRRAPIVRPPSTASPGLLAIRSRPLYPAGIGPVSCSAAARAAERRRTRQPAPSGAAAARDAQQRVARLRAHHTSRT